MDTIPLEKLKITFKNRYLSKANELGDDGKILDYLLNELAQAFISCCVLQTKYQDHIPKLLEKLGMKKDWWKLWKK